MRNGFLIAVLLVSCTSDESTVASSVERADCVFTQGYWKNHEEAWPVSSLTLGTTSYTKAQLLAILGTPVRGNGLVSLAHQLISAKLNVANGGATTIATAIASADALIGGRVVPPVGTGYLAPSATSALVGQLDAYNNSDGCAPPPGPICGNGILEGDEECDDGNTVDGDGCTANCVCEPPPPVCGNGVVEGDEQCDDGNTVGGDGCSATCVCEPAGPVCGNGIIEGDEECDDGNTVGGDGCSAYCVCEPA